MQLLRRILAYVGIISLLIAGLHHAAPPESVRLASGAELKQLLAASEFYLHSGAAGPGTDGNFFIAERPLEFEDTLQVAWRGECGLTPAWRGIVWVTEIVDPATRVIFRTDLISGNTRIWGNILAAGDEQVMDRIEELFRKRVATNFQLVNTRSPAGARVPQ